MLNIIKQEIEIEKGLKQKLEFICDFCNTTPKFINGSIRKIDKTNLSYIEPHRIIITENNDALNIKVKSLEKKIDKQEDEIDDLKEKNSKLQSTINFFENLFDRLVKFIKYKMFGKEKE